MKIKNLIFFILISAILTGLLVFSLISVDNKLSISRLNDDNQVSAPGNYATASISKGTILLLLIVGVIGFLGVSRKKKETGGVAQNNRSDAAADNQDFNLDEQTILNRNS